MNTPTPTPRTDAATYSADCLGKTLVTNRDCSRALECELTALTAERDQLRAENATLRAAQKACEACDEPTAFEVRQLRDQLAAAQQREAIAIASWDEERNRALREGERVVEWRDRAERAEAAETVALANWNGALERALKAEAERDHLHAQLRALTLICGTNDANKFETWIDRANARAVRAETELERLARPCGWPDCEPAKADHAELAAERARLDSGQILLTVAGERVWHCGVDLRAAIDAGMREDGAK